MRPFFLFLALAFGAAYFSVEKTGLFSGNPRLCIEILYSFPMLVDSLIILVLLSVSAIMRRKSLFPRDWLGLAALLIVVSGLWLGHFTRFSAEVILTEGQSFYSGHGKYLPEPFYMGRFAAPPDFGLTIKEINPSFSDDGRAVSGLEGRALFHPKEKGSPVEYTLSSGLPKLIEGAMFRIKKFGYSPRYELKAKRGKVLDSSFVFMELFPPGNEGSFRLLSPLTYYVRYFPEGNNDIKEPLIRLRIVRNKDIVLNRDVRLSEDAAFENSIISFEEVRMWTRLSVTRDSGEVMALAGLCLGFVYLITICIKFVKKQRTV
jgi:hypothetical protein